MTELGSVDQLVRSSRIILDSSEFDGSIGITGERITGLYARGEPEPSARHLIDASHLVVAPGLIDSHTHLREPGFAQKEDFTTGTRAAALGGVTTVMDMPNVDPPTSSVETFRQHMELAKAKSIVDFGHNAAGTDPSQIRALADAGASAFKIFMMRDIGRDYPHMPGTMVDDHARLYELFREIEATGLVVMVHPHDQSLWELFVADAWAADGKGPESYGKAWSRDGGLIFNSGVATALELQAATGVKLHVLHTTNSRTVQLISHAKRLGQDVTSELNPHCLFLGTWENVRRLGPYALGIWVPDQEIEHLWQAAAAGDIDIIGTDHAPHTREEKEVGWKDMFAAPGGSPSLQEYLSLLLTSVNEGRISLSRVVAMCATNPAKRFGLYPTKGTIQVGSDADLVFIDLERERVLTNERVASKCGFTPYAGRRVYGVPVMTMLRGTMIAQDDQVTVEPGFGEPLHSRIGVRKATGSDDQPGADAPAIGATR